MECGNFVLLSSGRKGTFLLITALRQHPNVFAHGQLIGVPDFFPGDTGEQVVARVFDNSHQSIRAVVLPVAWYDARNRYPGFWECLRARRVSVIYLKRRNMLRWHLSEQMAMKTGVWATKDHLPGHNLPRIRINAQACVQRVLKDRQDEEDASQFFADHPSMELVYEDVIRDFDGEMARLQRFLKVAPMSLKPETAKQESRPLHETIENFSELQRAWSGTEWECFLEDGVEPAVATDRSPGS